MNRVITDGSSIYTDEAKAVMKNSLLGVFFYLIAFASGAFLISSVVGSGQSYQWIAYGAAFILILMLNKFKYSWVGFGMALTMSGLLGYSVSGTLIYGMNTNPNLIGSVFLMAVLMVGSLMLYASQTKRRFNKFYGAAIWGVWSIIILSLVNVFLLGYPWLSMGISYAVLMLFTYITMSETQMILEGHEKSWIAGSVGIFLSLINKLLSLLNIFDE